jgi:hypothetical protein
MQELLSPCRLCSNMTGIRSNLYAAALRALTLVVSCESLTGASRGRGIDRLPRRVSYWPARHAEHARGNDQCRSLGFLEGLRASKIFRHGSSRRTLTTPKNKISRSEHLIPDTASAIPRASCQSSVMAPQRPTLRLVALRLSKWGPSTLSQPPDGPRPPPRRTLNLLSRLQRRYQGHRL